MGDSMQCPPSPLLFDPSLTLEDHSVKEIAEGSVDVLGQMQMAGDGCRSQGFRNSEKAASLPQSGVATANGKLESTSVS